MCWSISRLALLTDALAIFQGTLAMKEICSNLMVSAHCVNEVSKVDEGSAHYPWD